LLHRVFLSLVDVLPAAPLAASLVSFSCRWLSRRATRCIASFFHPSTSYLPCHSQYRLLLSLVDVLLVTPLNASLVSFPHRCLARAARCIACFFHLSTSRPPRCSLYRLILFLLDVLPAVPLAVFLFLSLVNGLPAPPLAASC
jgi:hypothetical protein